MSTYSNRYQTKTTYIHSSVPIRSQTEKKAHIKPGRFSNYNQISKFGSKTDREESFAYYLYNYVFQDYPDDTNIVFYDSNLKKFRTRSSMKIHSNKEISKTYKNLSHYKNKDSYYSASSSVLAKESAFSPNKTINSLNLNKKENAENKYISKGIYTNNMNEKVNEGREEMLKQLKKEKDELLASSNYSNSRKDLQENIYYKQLQNDKISGKNEKQKQKVKNFKEGQKLDSTKKNVNLLSQENKQKTPIKNSAKKTKQNEIEISSYQQYNQKIPLKKENQNLDYSNQNKTSPFLQNYQITKETPIKKISKSSNKKSKNIKKIKSPKKIEQSKKSPSKNDDKKIEDFQNNNISSSQKDKDINVNENNENQNLGISQNNKISKSSNQSFPKSLQNNPFQREMSPQNIKNMSSNEDLNRLSNISVLKKHEEKTLILVPGQTLEPKSKSEALENPIEEIIQNPDGTTTSIIKQTKIITTTENVPIEENKIISIEGAPELPMIKQYITYEYKTVSALKEDNKQGQGFDGQNKSSPRKGLDQYGNQLYGQQGLSQSGKKRNIPKGYEQYRNEVYGQPRI